MSNDEKEQSKEVKRASKKLYPYELKTSVTEELLSRYDNWRKKNNVLTHSEALRRLLIVALDAEEQKTQSAA